MCRNLRVAPEHVRDCHIRHAMESDFRRDWLEHSDATRRSQEIAFHRAKGAANTAGVNLRCVNSHY
jgi:hypothetical protein